MIFGSMQLLLTTTLLRMTTGDLTENRQKLTYLQLSLAETSPYSETNTFGAPETSVILNKINRLLNKQICLIESPPQPMGPLSTPMQWYHIDYRCISKNTPCQCEQSLLLAD